MVVEAGDSSPLAKAFIHLLSEGDFVVSWSSQRAPRLDQTSSLGPG